MGKQGLVVMENWKNKGREEIALVSQFPHEIQTGSKLDLHQYCKDQILN